MPNTDLKQVARVSRARVVGVDPTLHKLRRIALKVKGDQSFVSQCADPVGDTRNPAEFRRSSTELALQLIPSLVTVCSLFRFVPCPSLLPVVLLLPSSSSRSLKKNENNLVNP